MTVFVVVLSTHDGDVFQSVWSTRQRAEYEVERLNDVNPVLFGNCFAIVESVLIHPSIQCSKCGVVQEDVAIVCGRCDGLGG